MKADTRTPAPASDDAMEVLEFVRGALFPLGKAIRQTEKQAAAAIIQQYGDQREAAGFRRGVEAAAKVALEAQDATGLDWTPNAIARRILALLETQEASND